MIKTEHTSYNGEENTPLNCRKLISLSSKKSITTEDREKFSSYFRYLDEGLNNPNNYNIAISGKYGSGKSTIIDSYLNEKNSTDFLRVSLASFSFESTNSDNKSSNINNVDFDGESDTSANDQLQIKKFSQENSKLEQSIINQILYQIDSKLIPLTNFKIKHPVTFWSKIFFLFESLTILLMLARNFKMLDIKYSFILDIFNVPIPFSVYSLLTACLVCFLLINTWSVLKHIQFRSLKISLKNIDANIVDLNDNDNLFEKYINEIIYLFQSSNKKVLIIEDIDRFDDLSIFQQLRELNIKLNSTVTTDKFNFFKKIFLKIFGPFFKKNDILTPKQTKWTFLYLVRDDIFSDATDRVKFFDLIIPVIPYVTASNSALKLKNLFQGVSIDNKLFDILGTYIYDYRLLKNTYNEFLVFQKNLGDKDYNQLLALVAYKNVSPERFDALQNGQGDLKKINNSFRGDLLKRQQELISEKKSIKKFHSEAISQNEKELILMLLIRSGFTHLQSGYSYTSVNIMEQVDQFMSGTPYKLKIDGFEDKDWTYDELIQTDFFNNSIRNATSDKNFQSSISELNEKIKECSNPILKNITRQFWDDNQIEDNFLFALIKNGYINDHYLDIINHSYGSSQNEIFKRNLYSESEDTDAELNLSEIDHLVTILSISDFEKPQILNYSLLHYLLTTESQLKLNTMLICAVKTNTHFLEKFLTIYPNDFRSLSKKNIGTIKFDLAFLTNNINFLAVVVSNMYEDNDENIEVAVDFLSKQNLSAKEIAKYLTGNVYISLKEVIIQNIVSPINIKDVPLPELIEYYFKYDKIICSSKNINYYLKLLNPDISAIEELPIIFLDFIKRNANNIIFDEQIEKIFYDLILKSKNMSVDILSTIFTKYSETYPSYDASWMDIIPIEFTDVLIRMNLLEKSVSVLKKMIDMDIFLEYLFDTNQIVQIFKTEHLTTSNLTLLDEIASFESSSIDAFEIFSLSIVNFSSDENLLVPIFQKFIPANSECDKFQKMLTEHLAGHKINSNYKFINTNSNKNILNWFLRENIIHKLAEDNRGKLKLK